MWVIVDVQPGGSDKKLIASRQTDMRMIALLSFTTLLGKTARALARSGINRHVTIIEKP